LHCILCHDFTKKPDNVILLASLIFLSVKKKIGKVVKFFQLHTYIHVEKQFGLLAFAVDSGPAKDIFITITPRNAALQ
jgi:hypothetical protein